MFRSDGDDSMRTMTAAALVIAILLAGAASAGTPVQPKNATTSIGDYTKGRLYFPEIEFDFGYIPQGVSVSHSFWLINKGGDTLEVIQIRPG